MGITLLLNDREGGGTMGSVSCFVDVVLRFLLFVLSMYIRRCLPWAKLRSGGVGRVLRRPFLVF